MLIEFRVKNYLCFKDEAVLSMVASSKLKGNDESLFENHSFSKYKLLKSCGIYGANASGKTNLFKAFKFLCVFAVHSFTSLQANDSIGVFPFLLNSETENDSSFFEVTFIQEDTRYRYGFEINDKSVLREWLYYVPDKREMPLFRREGNSYRVSRVFKRRKSVIESTRNNSLYLSTDSQFNGRISQKVVRWFQNVMMLDQTNTSIYSPLSIDMMEAGGKEKILDFLRVSDLGIEQVISEKIAVKTPFPKISDEGINGKKIDAYKTRISFLHRKYNSNLDFIGQQELMYHYESQGSKKLFNIAGALVKAVNQGRLIFIDELDSSLHPVLTSEIISLFNSYENSKNAQLIFNTHNAFSMGRLRKDQIWLTEKNNFGEVSLYSILDFKGIRQTTPVIKKYLMGLFGGIPKTGNYEEIIGD